MKSKYETVIGLEVHVQLDTKTKAFCSCNTVFGSEPNTQVCPVCLGLPGVLPVLNKKAFEYAIKVAIAFKCEVQKQVKFDRKNYYYPDLPKNYQISQYDMPLAYKGRLSIVSEDGKNRNIGITRIHMEEDAGKLIHDPEESSSYVDLNRTGIPLLEIVSEPDIRTSEEAYRYLTILKQIIKYLGVSDCNMEEGSLRCDANISLRPLGSTRFGNKVEIKNLNSFKAVSSALLFEEARQGELLDEGREVLQETRLWDEDRAVTSSMRSKEEAQDYRYFPEPDLVPFEVSPIEVERIRRDMPELAQEKKARFMDEYKLNERDIEVLVSDREVADFFEDVLKYYNNSKTVSNWVRGELLKHMGERSLSIENLNIKAQDFAFVLQMVEEGTLSGLAAKEVLDICIDTGKGPLQVVKERGLEQVSDKNMLGGVIDKIIRQNEKTIDDYKKGKEGALSFLIGQAMKETKGKANPKLVGELLRERLK